MMCAGRAAIYNINHNIVKFKIRHNADLKGV